MRLYPFLLIIVTVTCATNKKTPYSILESFLKVLSTSNKYQDQWIKDTNEFSKVYDFIVVGGGTAGCTVAGRLSENPNHSILLLEAGEDEFFLYDIPILANYFQLNNANWKHSTAKQKGACLGLVNEKCKMPRGKVLGGSSVINYMIYTRGNYKDYDNWKNLGNYGWGSEDVLKYFKKFENVEIPEHRKTKLDRGTKGPVKINFPPYHTPIAEAFLKAGKELGFQIKDLNNFKETQIGFNYIEATIFNGTRMTSNRAYIMSNRYRKNLYVSKQTFVTKLLINPFTKRCYGVEFIKNKIRYKIHANYEVILSAGAFNSPQLLMLSGIGPSDHLKSLGIPVIQDLPVGYNLQDHIALGAFTFIVNQTVSFITDRIISDKNSLVNYFAFHRGPLSVPGGIEAIAFMNTKYNTDLEYPDIELLFGGGSLITDSTLRRCIGLKDDIYNAVFKPIEKYDAFTMFPMILRPKSKGRVKLASKNPFKYPIIEHNYLTHPYDIEIILEGIKLALSLIETKAFRQFGTRIHNIPLPACKYLGFGTDNYWRCAIRQITLNIYHQSGTAKMGPRSDPEAVVDPELKVYGIAGLRVIDVSIMPAVPSGHTNGPVFMIAEKGADMIKQYWRDV